jgi:SAM-dependent methyltransferase
MWRELQRRQTLHSFDYQWGELPDGDAMLSDPWFRENVDRIVWQELLGVDRAWFRGRRVLDAGCGGGRWTVGLLKLGATVVAADFSPRALQAARVQAEALVPDAIRDGRLSTLEADLLRPPAYLTGQRFDLVFSFGVLHHTGDTRGALAQIAPLVGPEGLLFLYLYGAQSVGRLARAVLAVGRLGLAALPFRIKRRALTLLLPGRNTHQAFDCWSPLINDRYEFDAVAAWLHELGFADVARTLDHTELYVRAARGAMVAPFLEPPPRPYWFERYRRR